MISPPGLWPCTEGGAETRNHLSGISMCATWQVDPGGSTEGAGSCTCGAEMIHRFREWKDRDFLGSGIDRIYVFGRDFRWLKQYNRWSESENRILMVLSTGGGRWMKQTEWFLPPCALLELCRSGTWSEAVKQRAKNDNGSRVVHLNRSQYISQNIFPVVLKHFTIILWITFLRKSLAP